MKYIDADILRKEIERAKEYWIQYRKNKTAVSEWHAGYDEGMASSYDNFLYLIDSLQQEHPINTELCTLIACDVIQATAKRAIEKLQDKDKEEDLMIKKMESLNMLEKSFFQQEQPNDLASLISEATNVAKRIIDRDSFYNSLPQNIRDKYTSKAWCEILEALSTMKIQEQPKVDLEKFISDFIDKKDCENQGKWCEEDIIEAMKSSFALGLNARKV